MDFFGKTAVFSGRIWPDWGNTAWADMAGLGSIGLTSGRAPAENRVQRFRDRNNLLTVFYYRGVLIQI